MYCCLPWVSSLLWLYDIVDLVIRYAPNYDSLQKMFLSYLKGTSVCCTNILSRLPSEVNSIPHFHFLYYFQCSSKLHCDGVHLVKAHSQFIIHNRLCKIHHKWFDTITTIVEIFSFVYFLSFEKLRILTQHICI